MTELKELLRRVEDLEVIQIGWHSEAEHHTVKAAKDRVIRHAEELLVRGKADMEIDRLLSAMEALSPEAGNELIKRMGVISWSGKICFRGKP